MDIAADSEPELAMTPEMEMHFHQLVKETGALCSVRGTIATTIFCWR